MHEPWLVGVVPEAPKKSILDQETVSLGYLVQRPGGVLTPDVYYIQLHAHISGLSSLVGSHIY